MSSSSSQIPNILTTPTQLHPYPQLQSAQSSKPWQLNQHLPNTNQIHNQSPNFSIQFVHVDRYKYKDKKQDSDWKSKSKNFMKGKVFKKSRSSSVSRKISQDGARLGGSGIKAERIVMSVSVWKERKYNTNSADLTKNNEKTFTKRFDDHLPTTKNPKSNRHSTEQQQQQDPTPYYNKLKTQCIDTLHKKFATQKQKTCSIWETISKNPFMHQSQQKIEYFPSRPLIPYAPQVRGKKKTIKQLLEYAGERNQRKQQFIITKLKFMINKAKITQV